MKARVTWFWLGLALLASTAVGCGQVQIAESPRTPQAVSAAMSGRPPHDLAVLGAEINPPLSGGMRVAGGMANFQLLVAFENRGEQAERDVIVEAWLKSIHGSDGSVLLTAKTIVPYAAPGEVVVAKLSAAGSVAMVPNYKLVVSVRPVLQEAFLGNNTSEYDILVSQPGS